MYKVKIGTWAVQRETVRFTLRFLPGNIPFIDVSEQQLFQLWLWSPLWEMQAVFVPWMTKLCCHCRRQN